MHVQGLKGRLQPTYRNGVKYFLDFSFKDTNPSAWNKKRCPCLNCRNYFDHDRATIRVHLLQVITIHEYSMERNNPLTLEKWGDELYDEDPLVSEEMASLVHDATNVVPEEHLNDGDEGDGDCSKILDKFHRLMNDAEEELF